MGTHTQDQSSEALDPKTEQANRLAKLEKLKAAGVHPYPELFAKREQLNEVRSMSVGAAVCSAGRIVRFRQMGKITFVHLQDFSGMLQAVFQKDHMGEEAYLLFTKCSDLGDFAGVEGEVFVTKTGEVSILVKKWTFLGKALLPIPEKFHGLKDQETLYRQRYLDLIANPETRQRFTLRSDLIRALREYYWQEGFVEVETPSLMHKATGAAARPYRTHNNALDLDLVLRISHELPLKELIVGGYEKVFEIGKAFRNEGHDVSHLPEHTHLEHYAAYWNFENNISFTERMFNFIFDRLGLSRKINIRDKTGVEREVDFTTPWTRVDFLEMLQHDSGLDVLAFNDASQLRAALRKQGIEFEDMDKQGLVSLIDNTYKKISRPKIINPTILYRYPKSLQPLARVNDQDARLVDQFQLVVNGWELVKAYSELVDPIDQRQRFVEQGAAKAGGDEEAMEVDEEYLRAMEHGMPPISGWGMGVDRVIALLTQQENLRDVVLFPLLKPQI